jgi:cell division protein FtsW
MITLDRTDRRPLSTWLWTVDLWSLGALILLSLLGIVLSFAASPAVAEREHYDSLHFVTRQIVFLVPAMLCLFGTSLLSPRGVRRAALIMLAGGILMLALTLVMGVQVKGATRWLDFGGIRLQASEFVKPAFVVISAFLFAEGAKRGTATPYTLAGLLYVIVVALLIRQPDFGQATLLSLTWSVMIFMTGVSWIWIALLACAGLGGVSLAYMFLPHVTSRIDRFVSESGDTFQVDRARDAIIHGGLTGTGPGEGVIKRVLPDAHADMIAAVGIEEFGLVLGLVLILLFGFIVLRGLLRAYHDGDRFTRLAATGLFVIFGFQAFINLGVNLNLLPAKGMTLPFVSYGGSSLVAMGIGMGFALALTRRRAKPYKLRELGQ